MPEIAEVETVRRTLTKMVLNKKIVYVKVLYEGILESNLDDFKKGLINSSFIDIKRKGKWLIFLLEDKYLLSHLRMEGKFFVKNKNDVINKHEHIIIGFIDNTELRYHDTRKFGKMKLIKKDELEETECIKKQGIEANDKVNLNGLYLYNLIRNRNISMKTLLLDQTIISGLGNIYADEVLFLAQVIPLKKGSEVTIHECNSICESSIKIIDKAMEFGGTTIKSYTSSLGVTGRFQQYLMVHKRENEKCLICGTVIKRIKVGGRSTYYCEKCQK
ncbi:MAG: DNA-formamidopyrimidine glycosylase [Bacilli bacterium]